MGISIITSGGGGGGGSSNTVPDYDTYINAVYEMNDSTGSTMEDAHGSFDLTKQAGTPTFGATGINGDAITQDSTSYFTRAFGSGFGFGTEDFLISTWFKSPDNTANRNIVSVNADPTVSGTNGLEIRITTTSSGSLSIKVNNLFLDSLDLDHAVWNHAILSRRGSAASDEFTSRLYVCINGICFGADSLGASTDFSSRTFSVGRAGSEQSDGMSFDQTRIYTRSGSPLFAKRSDLARFAADMWNDGDGYFDWS